jgi:diadenosine tetraphosphate (Ap4A) HIT family hydrolase
MALLDPYPLTRGHKLVIPVKHFASIFDIPDKLLRRIASLSRDLCRSYGRSLRIQGFSIEVMNHRQKTQAYRHFYLYIIPRYNRNDKRDPANVKPSRRVPRESDSRMSRTLAAIKAKHPLFPSEHGPSARPSK